MPDVLFSSCFLRFLFVFLVFLVLVPLGFCVLFCFVFVFAFGFLSAGSSGAPGAKKWVGSGTQPAGRFASAGVMCVFDGFPSVRDSTISSLVAACLAYRML